MFTDSQKKVTVAQLEEMANSIYIPSSEELDFLESVHILVERAQHQVFLTPEITD